MSNLKQFISDDSAVAYSLVFIVALFFLITVIYILSAPIVNQVFQVFNEDIIPMEIVSERTRDTLMFQRAMWQALPFFVAVFLLLIYPVIRALLEKRSAGE